MGKIGVFHGENTDFVGETRFHREDLGGHGTKFGISGDRILDFNGNTLVIEV